MREIGGTSLLLFAGNPNFDRKVITMEPFVFLNFYCNDCVIEMVSFLQAPWSSSGYESDRHTGESLLKVDW